MANGIKVLVLNTPNGKVFNGFSKDGKEYDLTNMLNKLDAGDYTAADLTEYINLCEGAAENIATIIDDAISHGNKKDRKEYSKMCKEIIIFKDIFTNKLNELI